eukprot:SAG11_NODE_26_length_23420_cov_40.459886_4_plen_216_part_00
MTPSGKPFELHGGLQTRGLSRKTVNALWAAVQHGLTATVGTPHMRPERQRETMFCARKHVPFVKAFSLRCVLNAQSYLLSCSPCADGDHQYAVERCVIYKGEECFVLRNPHNNHVSTICSERPATLNLGDRAALFENANTSRGAVQAKGVEGSFRVRRLHEIRESATDADRAVMDDGCFKRAVYMTKEEMLQPGLFTSCTIMQHLDEQEHVGTRD